MEDVGIPLGESPSGIGKPSRADGAPKAFGRKTRSGPGREVQTRLLGTGQAQALAVLTQILLAAEAVQDLADGMAFYESQQEGLGNYFLKCLAADIEGLGVTAGIHRKAYRDYFRLLSRVFPYAVYYTREKEAVNVWAVLDCRRDPAWIADHLKGKAKS